MRFYDFEVFKHDWLVVIKDTDTRERHVIHNDFMAFGDLYRPSEADIWVGYNNAHFDRYIAYGLYNNLRPQQIYQLSTSIINGASGYQVMKKFGIREPAAFYNYDCMANDYKSLKQLEGYMGDDIQECSVPFDIDRPLTEDELNEVIKYCEHDVDESMRVFVKRKKVFNAKMGLIKEFNLHLSNLSKSEAQLAAMILGARKQPRHDWYDLTIIDTLDIIKYKSVVDWYKKGLTYDEQFKVMVAGVMHVFGIGGIHGALKNYMGEGFYVMSDIKSQHPAFMIEYDFLSRNVPTEGKKKFKVIRDDRIVLKAQGVPKQESLKLVLNATNGAAKDPYNPLYDPRQNNNVCVNAQLSILDLVEHVEDLVEIIQSNTDGILVKLSCAADRDEYMRRCAEWESRTRLDLGHDDYVKIIQKDVNNYIAIEADGSYKAKGAYVKELNDLDNDLLIVNKAIVDYFVHGTSPEVTIGECRYLKPFQRIVKTSSKWNGTLHGNERLNGHVFRIFASKDFNDPGMYRIKDRNQNKVDGSPVHCYIDNSDINRKRVRVSRKLDKQWYIDLAHDRISKFLGVGNYKQMRLF